MVEKKGTAAKDVNDSARLVLASQGVAVKRIAGFIAKEIAEIAKGVEGDRVLATAHECYLKAEMMRRARMKNEAKKAVVDDK